MTSDCPQAWLRKRSERDVPLLGSALWERARIVTVRSRPSAAWYTFIKETDANEPNARTAAGVGLSAPGVGVSMAEGRGLCDRGSYSLRLRLGVSAVGVGLSVIESKTFCGRGSDSRRERVEAPEPSSDLGSAAGPRLESGRPDSILLC
jgi:hypothetical protein